MKMIAAMIQPFMLTKLTRALEEIEDFPGMTVTDVQGFGREKAHHVPGEQHSRMEDVVDFVKKVRVEIAAHDDMIDRIVETIVRAAHTGNRGDGKVFVWPLDQAIRIKTGETGDAAL